MRAPATIRARALSLACLTLVMVLMAVATTDPNHPKRGAFFVALALCLPALLAALPLLFVALALVWSLTNADNGGSTWPVTVAYVMLAGLVAACNLWVLQELLRSHRSGSSP